MTGVFFWVGQDLSADPQQSGYMWRTYVMSVLTNMIPVFLLYVASYFILRTLEQIRATEERENLNADCRRLPNFPILCAGLSDTFPFGVTGIERKGD